MIMSKSTDERFIKDNNKLEEIDKITYHKQMRLYTKLHNHILPSIKLRNDYAC